MDTNPTIQISPPPIEDPAAKKVAYGIYFLYLAAIALPMLPILAIIFAYIFENDAKGILLSHYRFLIRSFWIGILYFGVSAVCVILIVGWILLPLCIVWWVIRLVKGLKSLLRNEPIANPETWTF